jgi:hypothetical protein
MDENLHLNRVQVKCLQTFFAMSKLYEACQKLVISPSQDSISEISELASAYQETSGEFQDSLMDFLQNIAEPSEEIQITASQTDVGYKIN